MILSERFGSVILTIESKRAFLINTAFFATVSVLSFVSLKLLAGPLFPFAAAFVLTVSLQRFIRKWSSRLRLRKKAASVAVVMAVYAIAGGLIVLICYAIYRQLVTLIAALPQYTDSLLENIKRLSDRYNEFIGSMPSVMTNTFDGFPSAAAETVTKRGAEKAAEIAASVASGVPYFVFSVGVMIIASAYLAKDYDEICSYLTKRLPDKTAENLRFAKDVILKNFLKMMRGYLLIMLITFSELFFGFLILRLKYALLTAAVIAVIDIFPVLGCGTVLIPWAVFCALTGNMRLASGLVVLYLIITVIRNFIEPKIIGGKVGVHPLIMLAAAFLGLKVFGAGGILLLPVFAIIVKSWLESKGRLPKVQNKNKGGAPLKSVCFDSMKKKKCKKLGTKAE